MRHQGKSAIVTGAAQGIGLACATRLAHEGARVMLVDIEADKGARETAALGEQACFFAADVSIKAQVDAMVAEAVKRFGQIDILVNNAGIGHAADFLSLAEEDFDRVLRVNLKSMFLVGQAVAREMVRAMEDESQSSRGGVIINMSSVNAVVAIANQVPYTVSKGAINQLTRVMALNLAPYGIRVNAIGPGTIVTELSRHTVMSDDEARRRIYSRTPLGRCGEPEEVAAVASFLASEEASYFCGQTLYPDGGRLALNYTVPVSDSSPS